MKKELLVEATVHIHGTAAFGLHSFNIWLCSGGSLEGRPLYLPCLPCKQIFMILKEMTQQNHIILHTKSLDISNIEHIEK